MFPAPSAELQLTHGFFDQTLAYVGVLLGLYQLARLIGAQRPMGRWLIRLLIAWIHRDVLSRWGEAALLYQFNIGYSPLFFYHLEWESVRFAVSQHWVAMLSTLLVAACADRILRRISVAPAWPTWHFSNRLAVVVVLLFGLRCTQEHDIRSPLPSLTARRVHQDNAQALAPSRAPS